MASKKRGASASPRRRSVAEMQKYLNQNKGKIKSFEQSMDAIKQLRDVTKNAARNINSVDKETVVGYLQNPSSNEANLRNVSWYLLSRSQIFDLIVQYLTGIFALDARTVIPTNYDPTGNNNDDQILKSWVDTINMSKNWDVEGEFKNVISTCFIQDVSYNLAFYDDTGLMLYPMPADYCRIISRYYQYGAADFVYAINMNYFNSRQDYLEWIGEPLQSMYKQAQSGSTSWVTVPPEYSACFKARAYDPLTIIPPLSGIFGSLIDLLNEADIQAVASQQEIYKLLVLRLETLKNGVNDWAIDPAVLTKYFDVFTSEAIPDSVSAAILPSNSPIDTISFSSDKPSEVNKVENATRNVLNSVGVGETLDTANISTTSGYQNAILANQIYATNYLLPQVEGWFNRIANIQLSNPSKIHFFRTGQYTKDNLRKNLLEDAQNSLAAKTSIMALDAGFSPLESLAMNHLENDILKLGNKFNEPLSSSFTQSGSTTGQVGQGAPEKDPDELSDSGDRTKQNK